MKKPKKVKNRLPIDMVLALRRGTGVGAHSSKKGKKGYNRRTAKAELKKTYS